MEEKGLAYGPLGPSTVHLCLDMQQLFGPGAPWAVPWAEGVLPSIVEISRFHPAATIFTRFIPPERPGDARGAWRRYYERWRNVTREELPGKMLELLPELARFTPPARVFDKAEYSPWIDGRLHRMLRAAGMDTLVITGAETDVCVLAAVMGAVDLGYRVVLPTDAICSSRDATHDALLVLYRTRFSEQIETDKTENILAAWNR